MPGPKDQLLCLHCNTLKGLSAFKGGIPVCLKCRNKLKSNKQESPLPSTSLQPLPQIGSSEERKENIDASSLIEHPVDISHIEPSRSLYLTHVSTHPNQIKPGEWVYLIEGDDQIHTAPSYHQATVAAKEIRDGKRWFCTQHESPQNLDAMIHIRTSLNIKTGQVSSVRAATSVNIRNSYTETQLEAYGVLREEKNEETINGFIIDTGATVCNIPYTLAVKMKLRAEDHRTYFADASPGSASAVGNVVHIYFLDLEMQIPGLKWRKPRAVTLKSGTEDRLVGMSYLRYCKQIWTGDSHVEITDLDETKEPIDLKEPVSISVLVNSDMDKEAHETRLSDLQKLIENERQVVHQVLLETKEEKDRYAQLLDEQEIDHDKEMKKCEGQIKHWRDLAIHLRNELLPRK
jgi:hypothetical protein